MGDNEAIRLLKEMVQRQTELNALLLALVKRQQDPVRQNAQWKNDNPELAKRCAAVSEQANGLLIQLVEDLVTDLEDSKGTEGWKDSFESTEIADKYGYKLQQLHIIMQTLAQLSAE